MNIKKSWIIVLSVITALLLISIFIPDDYSVEQKQVINGNIEEVKTTIGDFSTWPYWAIERGEKLDSIGEVEISGELLSDNHKMIIKVQDEEMTYKLDSVSDNYISSSFSSAKEANDINFEMYLNKISEDKTEVRWVINGNLGYKPMLKIINMFIGVNKRLTLTQKKSLEKLEDYIE